MSLYGEYYREVETDIETIARRARRLFIGEIHGLFFARLDCK
jgi:hypothetical protein